MATTVGQESKIGGYARITVMTASDSRSLILQPEAVGIEHIRQERYL
jgi:hypothetical protein